MSDEHLEQRGPIRRVKLTIEIDNCQAFDAEIKQWLQMLVMDMEGELDVGEIISSHIWDAR